MACLYGLQIRSPVRLDESGPNLQFKESFPESTQYDELVSVEGVSGLRAAMLRCCDLKFPMILE